MKLLKPKIIYTFVNSTSKKNLQLKPKSQQCKILPKFLNKFQSLIFIKPRAYQLVQEIEIYMKSQRYQHYFESNIILYRYIGFLLHVWLLNHRLRKNLFSLNGFLTRRSLLRLLQQYTKDHVYQYDDNFSVQVYYELQRIKNAMFWSLDDYYQFDFKQKSIQQIINEDICIEQNTEFQQKIKEYIEEHRKYLDGLSMDQVINNHIYWGQIMPTKIDIKQNV